MKKSIFLSAVLALLAASSPVFAQTDATTPAAADQYNLSEEGRILQDVKHLYAKAQYDRCRTAIKEALERSDAGGLHFPNYYLSEIRVYQALLAYAFRETGYEKEVGSFLLQAVELNINYEFEDYSTVPTYILEQFLRIKKEYLNRFSKNTRRHNVGIYAMASLLSTYVETPQYINLGLHYGLNINEFFTVFVDGEFALSKDFFNLMQFRAGGVWFPSSKVETASLGLGAFYSLKIEDWVSFINAASIEGYGELIFRFGLGVGASVELLRLDILAGSGTFPTAEGYVPLLSSDYVRASFANLRLYFFWNF